MDNREQLPWSFEAVTIGTGKSTKQLQLEITNGTLPAGDYSIVGMETRVALERKSLSDLFGTLSTGRDRFVRELAKLNAYDYAAVIVESEWSNMMTNPPERSKFPPVSVNGLYIAYMVRYPRVHWVWAPDRYVASKLAYKILDRFYEEYCNE